MIIDFKIIDISVELKEKMIQTSVWKKDCPVAINKLKHLIVSHYDFSNEIKLGELVVHSVVAENVINIFKELFEIRFPIDKIKLINEYQGNDELSMEDNNSSCFNFRKIAGSHNLSMHAYGMAIDINPVQNPYILFDKNKKISKIYPTKADEYLNRQDLKKGMVESIVPIFAKYGFDEWGGDWQNVLDYQHFQIKKNKLQTILK